ncbi:testis-specific gene 10 protein-like isoform X1 [Belonocnema kinseyi]|uniref:testis-specific gene 10 protein-like isoform X1 n=1 Tax=Belonocnema kinseyi TaxID=2817044 RepID=UPI00143D9C80|nr:testis-specific gene 10 protein-like isoform X1 [Belonocnema kinseyi]
MSIDSMRVGGGRCPPLLVGGLLVVCLMLIINWYTLSSENLELLRQLDELGDQLRISAEERDQCVTSRGNLEQRFKHSEDEVASLHVRLAKQYELKTEKGEIELSLTACKTEVESWKEVDKTRSITLEALRLDKERISTQLDEKRDENKKLQEELEKVKSDLESAKLAINVPDKNKKIVEIVPQPTGRLGKGQLAPVPESAVHVSESGRRAQTNTKLKNSAENTADQELQPDGNDLNLKEAMNNIAQGSLLEDNVEETDNVANEDQKEQQKLATNELGKPVDHNV